MKRGNLFALVSLGTLLLLSSCKKDEPKNPVDPQGGGTTTTATKATAIAFKVESFSLVEGQKKKLEVNFTPSNATNKDKLEWSVQKPNIASITENGEVTARNFGETKIIARLGDIEAVCTLTVKKKTYPKLDVSVEQTFVTPIKVGFKIRPKDKNLNYYCDVTDKPYFYGEKVKAVGGIIEDEKTWWRLGLGSANKDKPWSDFMPEIRNIFFRTGDLDYVSSDYLNKEVKEADGSKKMLKGNGSSIVSLEWGKDYVFYMFTLDDDGNQTSEVFIKEFAVPKLKIDKSLTFDIQVNDITDKNCHIVVTPSKPNAKYYFTVQPKSFWDSRQNFAQYPELGIEESLMHELYLKHISKEQAEEAQTRSDIKEGKYEIIGGNGTSTDNIEYLESFHNYEKTKERVVLVFGVDEEDGPITLITSKPFRLKD